MDLKKAYDDSFFLFDGIVWTGSSLNIYDNTKEIKNQISHENYHNYQLKCLVAVGECNFTAFVMAGWFLKIWGAKLGLLIILHSIMMGLNILFITKNQKFLMLFSS